MTTGYVFGLLALLDETQALIRHFSRTVPGFYTEELEHEETTLWLAFSIACYALDEGPA